MNFRFLNLGTVGLSAGVAAFVYVGAVYRLDAGREVAASAAARFETELTRERAEQSRLSAEQRRLQETEVEQLRRLEAEAAAMATSGPDAAAIAAVRREALLTLAALRKQQIVSVSGAMGSGAFTQARDGSLPATFAEAFGLTAAEFGALQAAVAEMKNKLDQLSLASATVTRPQSGVVVMDVADGPEFAAQRDRLRNEFQQVLGLERFEAYEILQTGGVDRIFQGLGGPRVLTITRAIEGVRQNKLFTQTKSLGTPPGVFAGASETGSANFADIVRQLGALAKLLPENF
jgi:hypothetical protein